MSTMTTIYSALLFRNTHLQAEPISLDNILHFYSETTIPSQMGSVWGW